MLYQLSYSRLNNVYAERAAGAAGSESANPARPWIVQEMWEEDQGTRATE